MGLIALTYVSSFRVYQDCAESKLGSIHSVSADDYVNCNFSHDNGVEGRLDVNCKADY